MAEEIARPVTQPPNPFFFLSFSVPRGKLLVSNHQQAADTSWMKTDLGGGFEDCRLLCFCDVRPIRGTTACGELLPGGDGTPPACVRFKHTSYCSWKRLHGLKWSWKKKQEQPRSSSTMHGWNLLGQVNRALRFLFCFPPYVNTTWFLFI